MAKINQSMIDELQTAVEKSKKLDQLADLQAKRSDLMQKLNDIDQSINELLGGAAPARTKKAPARKKKTAGRKAKSAAKPQMPEQGSGAYKMVEVMGTKPMKKEEIAEKAGLSPATVSVYLNKFKCFNNVRGKGYTVSK